MNLENDPDLNRGSTGEPSTESNQNINDTNKARSAVRRQSVRRITPTTSGDNGATPTQTAEGTSEGWQEKTLKGKRPGDRYIRMEKTGMQPEPTALTAGLRFDAGAVERPLHGFEKKWRAFKRFAVGRPIPTAEADHQRLSKKQALAVFSSDALSSTAYATEEILLALAVIITAPFWMSIPIAVGIGLLLIIVAVSYRQTIQAYPQGGGSYIVAKDNLGTTAGLVAGGALMTDYVMTVAVSISSGTEFLASALPFLHDYRVYICLGFISLITLANLRGVRESGALFAVPTYIFIFSLAFMLIMGFVKYFTGWSMGGDHATHTIITPQQTENLTIFLILRAFSQGCTALTGIEAISDGVPAFRKPEYKNAQITLTWMAAILVTLFIGVTVIAQLLNIKPEALNAEERETLVSQIARNIFGETPFYFIMMAATVAILVLAANTAYSDFPRLSWFLARDKFLPHLFSHKGDRLALSTGIITLALLAGVLIILFNASVSALIPLYAVGVFTSFTLSQAGMVVRWWRLRTDNWKKSIVLNAVGATLTFIVLMILSVTKFLDGAWIIILVIPILYVMYQAIHQHYRKVAKQLSISGAERIMPLSMEHHTVVVPVTDLNQVSRRTLSYARALSDTVVAIHVSDNLEEIERVRKRWDEYEGNIPLVSIETPYRSVISPILAYLEKMHEREPNDTITVVIPEFIPAKWWQRLLHNQTAFRLRSALFNRPGIVVTSIPYQLHE
jgi:amino acid transporter